MANVDVFFSQIHVTFNGTVRSNGGTVETGYKVTGYKVNPDLR